MLDPHQKESGFTHDGKDGENDLGAGPVFADLRGCFGLFLVVADL